MVGTELIHIHQVKRKPIQNNATKQQRFPHPHPLQTIFVI